MRSSRVRRRRRRRHFVPSRAWVLSAGALAALLSIGGVALASGSQLLELGAKYGPLGLRVGGALAEQISAPPVAFALLSLILISFLLTTAVMWLLAGDPPAETLWLQNWPEGYREFGFLEVLSYDSDPMMQIFRVIGEEEVEGRWARPSAGRYSAPIAPGSFQSAPSARSAHGSLFDAPPAPTAFDEGRMPLMVRSTEG